MGHVFFLGQKYSQAMEALVLDFEAGKSRPLVMGCYGIGVGRTAAAAIEQNHDDLGMEMAHAHSAIPSGIVDLGKG